MSGFCFEPLTPPFKAWLGPFSPARGTSTGFRVHRGELGVWHREDDTSEFWTVVQSPGVRSLQQLVTSNFHGGRILLLPNGHVIKPLNDDWMARGHRVLIGHWSGAITIKSGHGSLDFLDPRHEAGAQWPGPSSIGLECVMGADGSIHSDWWRQTDFGAERTSCQISAPNPTLASAFRKVRLVDSSGRVHVAPHGLVLTNVQRRGVWTPYLVGWIDPDEWPHRDEWIGVAR